MQEPGRLSRTILFADVSGSTRLFNTLGDQPARAVMRGLLDELIQIVHGQKGEIVKTIGDELMCAFPDPGRAAYAAQEMQILTTERRGTLPLSVRIGFHHGPVLAEAGDYYGDAVNIAARVASVATSERILTTAAAHAMLPAYLTAHDTRHRGQHAFKGIAAPVEIHEVLWRAGTEVAPSQFATDRFEFAYTTLRLCCRGREYVIDRASGPLGIGREPGNGVAIAGDICVSGRHASIELWGGQFVLVDTSSNGTHVSFEGGDSFPAPKEVPLRLRKTGTLWFGRWPRDPEVVSATFVCQ